MKANSGLVVRGCFVLTASAAQEENTASVSTYEVEQLQWSLIPGAGAPQLDPDQFDFDRRDLMHTGDSGSWVANWHFLLDCGGRRSAGP